MGTALPLSCWEVRAVLFLHPPGSPASSQGRPAVHPPGSPGSPARAAPPRHPGPAPGRPLRVRTAGPERGGEGSGGGRISESRVSYTSCTSSPCHRPQFRYRVNSQAFFSRVESVGVVRCDLGFHLSQKTSRSNPTHCCLLPLLRSTPECTIHSPVGRRASDLETDGQMGGKPVTAMSFNLNRGTN